MLDDMNTVKSVFISLGLNPPRLSVDGNFQLKMFIESLKELAVKIISNSYLHDLTHTHIHIHTYIYTLIS